MRTAIAARTAPCEALSFRVPGRLTLPARLRLRRKGDFDAVQSRGRRFGDGFFTVTISANPAGTARLGLAVGVRVAGGAVGRNRIRRIVRESFRVHQHEIPCVDLVVSARAAAAAASGRVLHASLAALWKRVGEQCGTSRSS